MAKPKIKKEKKNEEIIDAEIVGESTSLVTINGNSGSIDEYDPETGNAVIKNPKNPRKLTVKEKQRQAALLRLSGARYDQIAEILGYSSPSGAQKAATAALENFSLDTAKELYKVHYGRLEYMLQVVWPAVEEGDLSAIAAAAGIMDRIERISGITSADGRDNDQEEEGVLVVGGNQTDYIEALRKVRR